MAVRNRFLETCLLVLALSATSFAADEQKPNRPVMEVRGYLVAANPIVVGSRISGRIVEMPIVEGKHVKAGDVLARLDSAEQEANLRLARAELNLAEAGAVKAKEGNNKAEVAMSLAKVEVAKARLTMAQIALNQTVIKAPIDGVILSKREEAGNSINLAVRSGDLCEMADLRKMEVDVEIPERDIGRVAQGQPCRIELDSMPNKRFAGRVDRIWPVANSAKAIVAVRIRLELPANDGLLRPQTGALVAIMPKE